MLRCFYLIFGLKININKCNILGIGVSDDEVSSMASVIGCEAVKFPFKYLGVPVECNMSRCSYWNDILQKFATKLSAWKARMLSVGDAGVYSKEVGVAAQQLFHWRRSRRKDDDLSHWSGFIAAIKSAIKLKGIDLLSLCERKIGNGTSCCFWDDLWCGNHPLKMKFPRIFQLELAKECYVADRIGISDWNAVLRRPPRGGAELSQLTELNSLIQNVLDDRTTRWNRLIPIKVNVFIWRLILNKLPTRVNLDRKDIDVGSILCPICMEDVETANHIFCSCNMAKDLWSMFAKWWDIDIPVCANYTDWFEWLDDLNVSNKVRSFIKGVGDSLLWHIWKFRNELIFSSTPPKKALL
ncbi:RNA-directed DNA polymerase, eukaryota, reverse transcriptase zinc-binding domain protein [Tanacetum coccineum]